MSSSSRLFRFGLPTLLAGLVAGGVMYRKGEPELARLVNDTFHRLAEDGEIERRHERWFLQKLPSGISLDLPMGPQLETLIQTMVVRSE